MCLGTVSACPKSRYGKKWKSGKSRFSYKLPINHTVACMLSFFPEISSISTPTARLAWLSRLMVAYLQAAASAADLWDSMNWRLHVHDIVGLNLIRFYESLLVFLYFEWFSHMFIFLFIDFNRFPWILMIFMNLSIDFHRFHGFSWICIDFHGFSWFFVIFIDFHDLGCSSRGGDPMIEAKPFRINGFGVF